MSPPASLAEQASRLCPRARRLAVGEQQLLVSKALLGWAMCVHCNVVFRAMRCNDISTPHFFLAARGTVRARRGRRRAHATALAICAHTSPPCGPCAREIKNALLHTWGYEGCPWTSNDCAQASHTEKNARAHDFSQKRCDALRSVTVARKRRADSFRAAGQWPTIHTTRPVRQHYL